MIAEVSLPNLILAVTAETIIALLVGYVSKRAVGVWSAIWRVRVRYVLAAILLLTGPVVVYIVFSWFLEGELSSLQFQVAFCASLAQVVSVYLLYYLFHHEIEQRIVSAIDAKGRHYHDLWNLMEYLAVNSGKSGKERQYERESMCVEVRESGGTTSKIQVHRLSTEGLNPGERLFFNARTLTDGAAFMKKQVDERAPVVEPDVCVGINNVGGVLAGYFSRTLGAGQRLLGFVRTDGQRRLNPVTDILLPKCKRAKTILVADIEVKRGLTLAIVSDLLRKKYGKDARIVIAVLVGSEVRGPIEQMEQLRSSLQGVFEADSQYLPDFFAFTTSNKVRLYGNIR